MMWWADAPPVRPDTVTAVAALGAVTGGWTLFGTVYVVVYVFSGGESWFTVAATALVVVQVLTSVLLFVGAARLVDGRGRGPLLAGIALEFLVCVVHVGNAVVLVAGDPDDAGVVGIFVTVPCVCAVVTAGLLYLASRPSVRAYASRDDGARWRAWGSDAIRP